MGFCLFNNVALCARYLSTRYGMERVFIMDIDVHHGNGTQTVFYDSPAVLYVSWHQFPAYPGTGKLGEVGRNAGEAYRMRELVKEAGLLDGYLEDQIFGAPSSGGRKSSGPGARLSPGGPTWPGRQRSTAAPICRGSGRGPFRAAE